MPVRHQPMLPIGRVAISVALPNSGELRNAAKGPQVAVSHAGARLTART